ncbi:Von Willebrand factor, type A [Flavobacterium daejeonense]|nr:Von Willebrand factor, type A [Flavobacterium daejeonense]
MFYNLALANAKDSENINVNDTSSDPTPCTTCPKDPECTDCTITVLPQTPELTVDKTAVVNTRDTTSDVYTFVGDVINYTIAVTNTGNVSIYNVVVKDPLTGLDTTNEPFVLNPGESKEFTQSHTITLADLQEDSITNIATANGVTLGNTPVEAEDSVIVEKAGVLGCGTILVHNAFTPNNDNINEVFKIDNIDDTLCYPENSVEIYNRWGILVYETKGYNNEDKAFKGFSEGRVTVDKSAGLPDGTYFYILNYTSVGLQGEITAKKQQGYLYLTR